MLANSNEACVEFGGEIWIFQKRSAWKSEKIYTAGAANFKNIFIAIKFLSIVIFFHNFLQVLE